VFANRYTALVDACSLAGTLRRNLLLTLAEAEFFRVRWLREIMEETQAAIEKILQGEGASDAAESAARARRYMEDAFEDAMVADYQRQLGACEGLPDRKDAHVLAAAIKTRAHVIVTENLKDFPAEILDPLGIDVRCADVFIADTVALDFGRAVPVVARMRKAFTTRRSPRRGCSSRWRRRASLKRWML
jgi:phosphoglycolate phosphatase-like HAD superfamily hydrolase